MEIIRSDPYPEKVVEGDGVLWVVSFHLHHVMGVLEAGTCPPQDDCVGAIHLIRKHDLQKEN